MPSERGIVVWSGEDLAAVRLLLFAPEPSLLSTVQLDLAHHQIRLGQLAAVEVVVMVHWQPAVVATDQH